MREKCEIRVTSVILFVNAVIANTRWILLSVSQRERRIGVIIKRMRGDAGRWEGKQGEREEGEERCNSIYANEFEIENE